MPRRERRGFDPERLDQATRPTNLVPRILAATPPTPAAANAFTEIRVVGVGGAGSNAVERMAEMGLPGVAFVAVNTDAQSLANSSAHERILIGPRTTKNLGSGGDPRLGERAAVESTSELAAAVDGADMVFIAAGMGGGTGTGAAPTIAELAREAHALSVGVVTLPFGFEGRRRAEIAAGGVRALAERVDAIIVVHNDKLLEAADAGLAFADAFDLADEMLHRGVQGVTDLITTTGLINVDFADVRTVMADAGTAMMGVGEVSGEERAMRALHEAMRSPLLDTTIDNARGVLLNFTGSDNMTLAEINEASRQIFELAAPDATIIFGSVTDPSLRDAVRVTLIATGFRAEAGESPSRTGRRPRRARAARAAPTGAMGPSPIVRELDLGDAAGDENQIPAFIRRRRDQ